MKRCTVGHTGKPGTGDAGTGESLKFDTNQSSLVDELQAGKVLCFQKHGAQFLRKRHRELTWSSYVHTCLHCPTTVVTHAWHTSSPKYECSIIETTIVYCGNNAETFEQNTSRTIGEIIDHRIVDTNSWTLDGLSEALHEDKATHILEEVTQEKWYWWRILSERCSQRYVVTMRTQRIKFWKWTQTS